MDLRADEFPEVPHQKERCQQKFGIQNKYHQTAGDSTTGGDSTECSVRGSQTTLPLQSSTPVSTDTRILEHFEQMQILISGFLQQRSTSDRQPFYDYVASEADKMSPEEYENFKVQVFNAIQYVKSSSRRQFCQDGQLLLQQSHGGSGYYYQQHRHLPAARQVQPVEPATVSTTHQILLVSATLH